MAVQTTKTNKPLNPRGQDQSPKGYNRAELYTGKALDFDGVNDQITFGTISDLTFGTGDFSAVLDWQIDSVSTYSWAIAKDPSTDFGIGINNTGGLLRLWIGGTLSLGTENILGSDWKKIAVVRESGVVSAYINGVAISLTETAMAGSIDSGDLLVGSWVSNADFWNGLLNNIRIFNTALTAAQVADLYNNPEKIVPTGVDNDALKLWLPMQEGAGTTAYDGSGNNLGSEEVTNGDFATDSDWTKEAGWTINGGKATFDGSATTNALYQSIGGVSGTRYILSFEVTGYVSGSFKAHLSNGNTSAATPSINANGKYVFDITATGALILFRNETSFNGSIDNVSVKELTSYGAISGATWTHGIGAPVAQTAIINWNKHTLDGTNEVLIPQGLTTGRDLLGNLFENVRKQGALNLDGNSWAEVHDNASLDVTDAITLEAWVYFDSNNSNRGLLGKWYTSSNDRAWLIYQVNATQFRFIVSDNGTNTNAISSNSLSEGWNHFVGVDDGTNIKVYSNGSLDSTGASFGSLYEVNKSLEIARWNSETIKQFPNQIAQPRIYNRALTAEEVERNYNAGKNTYSN